MATLSLMPTTWLRLIARRFILQSPRRVDISTRQLFSASSQSGANSEDKKEGNNETQYAGLGFEELQKMITEKDSMITEKENAFADLKDRYMRALAEQENLLARNKKIVEDTKLYAIQSFSKDLLDVADILEKAIESVPQNELKQNAHLRDLYEGLTMTENKLQKVFEAYGLEKINPIGEKFDPNFHSALFMQSMPGKKPGTVAIVEKIGYKLKNRPLRVAMVGVVKEG